MGTKLAPAPEQNGSQAQGQPLPAPVRHQFEAQMGANFSDVRVHSDLEATVGVRAVGASAFTRGTDIFFTPGQYNPGSPEGRELLAHELTHVVQQRAGQNVDVPKGTTKVDTDK